MERSASSSSILRSRGSNDREDQNPRASLSMGVTIVNVEELPTYSTERYYMLAEIEQHGAKTIFLSEDENSTQDTEELSIESNDGLRLARFCILYVLWRPEMSQDPKVFTETIVLDAITKLRNHVTIENSAEEFKEKKGIFASLQSRYRAAEGEQEAEGSAKLENSSSSTRVYLVIDRLETQNTKESMSEFFASQEVLAKQLSREISSHPTIRGACEGLVVGLSNHSRAAPGLEACMNAVAVGTSDRGGSSTSLIGLIAQNTEDLLGLDPEGATDAAQGVWQRRVTAEWGGQGNLLSFATRSHHLWCLENGVYYDFGRRRRRTAPTRRKEEDGDMFVNFLAISFIVGYVAFHFSEEMAILWNMIMKVK